MIKTRYRDYAVDAFHFYGLMHKPKSVRLAEYRLKEYLLTNGIDISKEQFTASMDDLAAVIKTIDLLKHTQYADNIMNVLKIYTDIDPYQRGNIENAIIKASLTCYLSTATINRYLKIARDTFAEVRGLRVSA